jgi:type I restriction enzyme R subunit
MGDTTLAASLVPLVKDLRTSLSDDWLSREPVRAKPAHTASAPPARFDYPPEEERAAVELVIKR